MTTKDYNKVAKSGISPEAFHIIHTEREKIMISSCGKIKEPSVVCSVCEGHQWMALT